MVTYSSILAWEIPVRIQFMDFQKVRHDLMTKQQILILLIDIMEIKSNSWANTSDKFHMHTHTHTHTSVVLTSVRLYFGKADKSKVPRNCLGT